MAEPVRVPGVIWVPVEIVGTEAKKDPVELSRTRKQEVQWYSAQAVTVKFPGKCPFAETEFHVPAGGSVCSGPITTASEVCDKPHPPNDHEKGHYAYVIHKAAGPVPADPQIIILP